MRTKARIALGATAAYFLVEFLTMAWLGMPRGEIVQMEVLSYGFTFFVGLGAVTIYLHRHLTHQSITLKNAWVMYFRICIYLYGMVPREWAGVHEYHHLWSDTEKDPHSPWWKGFWTVFLNTAGLFHRAKQEPEVLVYINRHPTDKWDRRVFDKPTTGPFVLAGFFLLVLLALNGLTLHLLWLWPLIWGRATLFFLWAGGAINALAHTDEEVHIDTGDHSSNLGAAITLATMGEGQHHNHHVVKGSARFGRYDVGWWGIRLIKQVRGVTINHVEDWKQRGLRTTAVR